MYVVGIASLQELYYCQLVYGLSEMESKWVWRGRRKAKDAEYMSIAVCDGGVVRGDGDQHD